MQANLRKAKVVQNPVFLTCRIFEEVTKHYEIADIISKNDTLHIIFLFIQMH